MLHPTGKETPLERARKEIAMRGSAQPDPPSALSRAREEISRFRLTGGQSVPRATVVPNATDARRRYEAMPPAPEQYAALTPEQGEAIAMNRLLDGAQSLPVAQVGPPVALQQRERTFGDDLREGVIRQGIASRVGQAFSAQETADARQSVAASGAPYIPGMTPTPQMQDAAAQERMRGLVPERTAAEPQDRADDLMRQAALLQQRLSRQPALAPDAGTIRELAGMAVQSAPAMGQATLNTVAGGLIGGPAGAGAAAFGTTAELGRLETITDLLAEEGIDPSDTDALRALVQDPERRHRFEERATRGGLTQGAIEGLFSATTFGLGQAIPAAASTGGKILRGAGAYAGEVGGEGIGEAGRMIGSGQDMDPAAIRDEMVLAAVLGGVPVSISAARGAAQIARGERTVDAVESADTLPLPQTADDAVQQTIPSEPAPAQGQTPDAAQEPRSDALPLGSEAGIAQPVEAADAAPDVQRADEQPPADTPRTQLTPQTDGQPHISDGQRASQSGIQASSGDTSGRRVPDPSRLPDAGNDSGAEMVVPGSGSTEPSGIRDANRRDGSADQATDRARIVVSDGSDAQTQPLADPERQQYVDAQDFDGYTRAVAERSDDADEIAGFYEYAREQETESGPDAAIASALSGTRLLTSDFDAIMGSAAREGSSSTLRYLGTKNAQSADAIAEAVREQTGMEVTREQVAEYVARQGQQQGPRLSEQLAERYRAVTGKSIESTQQQAPTRQSQPMDDVPFRRAPQSDPQASGQKVARVQRAANATGLGGFVRVVESEADLPTPVREKIEAKSAQGKVRGVYFDGDGEVYVVASNLPADPAEAARTIFHETIGHRGLRATLGPRVDSVLDAVHRSFERDAAYLDIVGTYKLDTTTEAGRREAAEEFVARMAEDEKYHSEKLYQRVVRIIQKAYRKLSGGAEMSTADVHALIARAAKSARSGARPEARGGSTVQFQKAPPTSTLEAFATEVGEGEADARGVKGKLLAVHNLRAAGIRFADKLGGLPMPSLAVVRAEQPFTNFGEITLVAPKDIVDPAKGVPVFDADIYSPRIPRAVFTFNEKAYRGGLFDKLTPYWETLEETHAHANYLDKGEKGDKSEFLSRLEYDEAAKLAYLNEQGESVEVPMKADASPYAAVAEDEAVRELVKPLTEGRKGAERYFRGPIMEWLTAGDNAERFKTAVRDAYVGHQERTYARIKDEHPDVYESLMEDARSTFSSQSKSLPINQMERVLQAIAEGGKKKPDHPALRTLLEEKMKGREEAFKQWANEQTEAVFGEPRLVKDYATRRTEPYTLDRVTRTMKRAGLRDAEGFNYGPGSARSRGAKQFRDLDDMRGEADRIMDDDSFAPVKEELSQIGDDVAAQIRDAHGDPNSFGYIESFYYAVGEFYDGASAGSAQAKKERAARKALKDNGYSRVITDEHVDLFIDFAERLRSAPTEYFEAKPRRAVQLSEFVAAIVPEDVPADVRAILEREGMEVETYADKADRALAVDRLEQRTGAVRFHRDPSGDGQMGPPPDPREAILKAALERSRQRKAAGTTPASTTPRPDLANPGTSEDARTFVDAADTAEPNPAGEPETFEQWEAEARDMLARDREGVERMVLSGGKLESPALVKAAQILVDEAAQQAMRSANPADTAKASRLTFRYREARSENARTLAAGRDPMQTPEQRRKREILEAVFEPDLDSRNKLRQLLDSSDKRVADRKRAAVQKAEAEAKEKQAAVAEAEQKLADLNKERRRLSTQERRAADRTAEARAQIDYQKKREAEQEAALAAAEAEVKKRGDELAKVQQRINKLRAEAKKLEAKIKAKEEQILGTHVKRIEGAREVLEGLGINTAALSGDGAASGDGAQSLPPVLASDTKTADAVQALRAFHADWLDKSIELWRAGLLSGLKTFVVNVTGNTLEGLYTYGINRPIQTIINTLVPGAKSDAPTLGEMSHLYGTLLSDVWIDATRAAVRAFQTELPQAARAYGVSDDATKYDGSAGKIGEGGRVVRMVNKAMRKSGFSIKGYTPQIHVGRTVRIPYRALLFMDEAFKAVYMRMEINAISYRRAAENMDGATHEEIGREARKLAAAPSQEMIDEAYGIAKDNLFQSEPGGFGQGVQKIKSKGWGRLFNFILPFTSTPGNLVKKGIRRTPLGGLALMREIKAGSTNRANITKHAADQLIAWPVAITLLSLVLGQKDDEPRITGSPARWKDSGKRNTQYRAAQPTSIRIGDKWYDYSRLDPHSITLSLAVDAAQGYKEAQTADDASVAWAALFDASMRLVTDQSYLQGVGDIVRAIEDPNAAESWAKNFAASWTPNVIKQVGRASSPDLIKNETIMERAFPGFVGGTPRVDVWGRPIQDGERASSDFLYRLLSPVRVGKADLLALDRLVFNWNAQYHTGEEDDKEWYPSVPDDRFTHEGRLVKMTPPQHQEFIRRRGVLAREILDEMIRSGDMDVEKPTATEIQIMQKVLRRTGTLAKGEMLSEGTFDDQIQN